MGEKSFSASILDAADLHIGLLWLMIRLRDVKESEISRVEWVFSWKSESLDVEYVVL